MHKLKQIPEDLLNKIYKNPHILSSEDWNDLASAYTLPQDFLIRFKDKISWHIISYWQDLSCEFMDKYFYHLDWYWVSIRQYLTKDFIIKHDRKLFFKKIPLCYFNLNNNLNWKSFI